MDIIGIQKDRSDWKDRRDRQDKDGYIVTFHFNLKDSKLFKLIEILFFYFQQGLSLQFFLRPFVWKYDIWAGHSFSLGVDFLKVPLSLHPWNFKEGVREPGINF